MAGALRIEGSAALAATRQEFDLRPNLTTGGEGICVIPEAIAKGGPDAMTTFSD
jgi:hypothetical protein